MHSRKNVFVYIKRIVVLRGRDRDARHARQAAFAAIDLVRRGVGYRVATQSEVCGVIVGRPQNVSAQRGRRNADAVAVRVPRLHRIGKIQIIASAGRILVSVQARLARSSADAQCQLRRAAEFHLVAKRHPHNDGLADDVFAVGMRTTREPHAGYCGLPPVDLVARGRADCVTAEVDVGIHAAVANSAAATVHVQRIGGDADPVAVVVAFHYRIAKRVRGARRIRKIFTRALVNRPSRRVADSEIQKRKAVVVSSVGPASYHHRLAERDLHGDG